jgi:hypothetical protein
LISQVINLSNSKSFKLYKEKYNYSILLYHGLYGIELRNIPMELSNSEVNTNLKNIFYAENNLLIIGSIKEILDTANSQQLNNLMKSEIAGAYKTRKVKSFNINW